MSDEKHITFPHFIMTNLFTAGDHRTHAVEQVLSHIWSIAEHAHVFRVEFLDELGTWEGYWIEAPSSYWEGFLDTIHAEHRANLDNVLEGFDDLLAESSEPEND